MQALPVGHYINLNFSIKINMMAALLNYKLKKQESKVGKINVFYKHYDGENFLIIYTWWNLVNNI